MVGHQGMEALTQTPARDARLKVSEVKMNSEKSPAQLEGLAQEVERLLLDETATPRLLSQISGGWRRLTNALREMCSEMATLQLALAQAKTKIKVLEEQLYVAQPGVQHA
jgi:hypothetical protein